ncbi:MAG: glutamate-1-semialdehyde 2,1-aminomutase [Candidatus Omnitrophota bacterium]|nr:glutamate-1-semialdehyde 2,1-aminomutase [Candidatus Omnitrophota bacterium]
MAKRAINSKLFYKAKKYLVGGVNSPVRAFNYVGGEPLIIKKGRGSKVYDHDGNEYIDYVLSWGSLILGHAFPEVVNAVKAALGAGLSFGTTNMKEVELAKLIQKAIPLAEKIRFVNSGTEAVMGAVRLARGYTGRDEIVKFENAYHGHADYLLTKSGSGLATLGMPSSAGVPEDFIKHTIITPFNDIGAIENAFKKYGRKIAAVLVEPVGCNYGVVLPDVKFLKRLRELTAQYGSLLIFDEVITGFRFNFGSAAQKFGIIPDLIVLGKIIGGGLPIGAYCGRKEIMDKLAPLGGVYQASTFSGNPVVMQAGISTLPALAKSKAKYRQMEEFTEFLTSAIDQAARSRNIGLKISRFGSMFSMKFDRKDDFEKFYKNMLRRGIYFAPSEFEANFLSFAHTKKDVEKTADVVSAALVHCKISC